MKKCDPQSIVIIKYMVDVFRLTFRYIFPTFIKEVIGELKEGLLVVLREYPELLPLPPN